MSGEYDDILAETEAEPDALEEIRETNRLLRQAVEALQEIVQAIR